MKVSRLLFHWKKKHLWEGYSVLGVGCLNAFMSHSGYIYSSCAGFLFYQLQVCNTHGLTEWPAKPRILYKAISSKFKCTKLFRSPRKKKERRKNPLSSQGRFQHLVLQDISSYACCLRALGELEQAQVSGLLPPLGNIYSCLPSTTLAIDFSPRLRRYWPKRGVSNLSGHVRGSAVLAGSLYVPCIQEYSHSAPVPEPDSR